MSTNTEYYRINSNSGNNEINFVSDDTPITALTTCNSSS